MFDGNIQKATTRKADIDLFLLCIQCWIHRFGSDQLTLVICCHWGGENEKLQSSYVGIFLFICRIKQTGIPGTSKHVISFRWKKGHLSGSSHVANTHSHHFWEGDEAQVSMLPRCAGVVFCAFQVVGFFSDLEKWKRNTKNGHVIHVPVLTKILFFSK